MEQQSAHLDLTIISAADLKRGWLSGEETSALAWVDSSAKKWTSIVKNDGSNVQWPHEKLSLSFNGDDNVSQGKLLTIEIYARGMLGVSLLGSVYVPLIELTSDGEKSGSTILMYQIVQPSGNEEGSLKFSARVVQPASSDAPVSVSGIASRPATPIRPLEDDPNSFGFKAMYPSPSVTRAIETTDEPYPPQRHFPRNFTARNDSWQHNESPDPSHGSGSYPPHVYPPINADYPSHTSPAPCWPHSNHTGNIPYPPPCSLASEIPYPPVHPPPKVYSGSPYPPIAPHPQFPQTGPQHPPEMYSSTFFYTYSRCAHPLYPPSYARQPATGHYP